MFNPLQFLIATAALHGHIVFTNQWDKARTVIAFGQAKAAVQFPESHEFKQEGPMPSSHNFERVYGPDTLKIMAAAFDSAHKCLPAKFRENDQARRKLALLILRHIERGEHNPRCLADLAVLDFLR